MTRYKDSRMVLRTVGTPAVLLTSDYSVRNGACYQRGDMHVEIIRNRRCGLSSSGIARSPQVASVHGACRRAERNGVPPHQPHEKLPCRQGVGGRRGCHHDRGRVRHALEPPPSHMGLPPHAAELARPGLPAVYAAVERRRSRMDAHRPPRSDERRAATVRAASSTRRSASVMMLFSSLDARSSASAEIRVKFRRPSVRRTAFM